jgi:hypothetical protein
LAVSAVLVVACAAAAWAGPVQLEEVPADAKWLAHVDVDAMRSSAVIEKFFEECVEGQKPGKLLDKMAEQCGMDPRKELHGVTLYGTKIAKGQCVVIVRAEMDKDRLLEKAENCPDHRREKYRDHEIHIWTHKQGGRHLNPAGAFHKAGVLVLGSGPELLRSALDVFDGRAANLQGGDSPLATEIPNGTMFLARATGIRQSEAGEKSAICSQLDRLDYAEG